VQHQHPRERSERGSPTAKPTAEPSAFFIDVFAPSGSPEANPRRKKVAPCIQHVSENPSTHNSFNRADKLNENGEPMKPDESER